MLKHLKFFLLHRLLCRLLHALYFSQLGSWSYGNNKNWFFFAASFHSNIFGGSILFQCFLFKEHVCFSCSFRRWWTISLCHSGVFFSPKLKNTCLYQYEPLVNFATAVITCFSFTMKKIQCINLMNSEIMCSASI